MADKFKTGKLCILQDKTQQPTDSDVYNFYFSDHMTIVIRNDNKSIIVLPPFKSREAYGDNFDLTSYLAGEQIPLANQLKSFLWSTHFFILKRQDDESLCSSFDQNTHTINIPLKEQTKYCAIDVKARSYEMEQRENNKIIITPSTTPQELVQQLPKLHTNIRQAIEFATEEDKECCNCGGCLDLTKLKFWENKEK